jgi:hypothetical protein
MGKLSWVNGRNWKNREKRKVGPALSVDAQDPSRREGILELMSVI